MFSFGFWPNGMIFLTASAARSFIVYFPQSSDQQPYHRTPISTPIFVPIPKKGPWCGKDATNACLMS
jgi:hypothetical protein